jgi:triosephosphate isomerase
MVHATILGMKQRVPLIVGNWKLNPVTLTAATALAAGVARRVKQTETPYVAVAPPFPYLLPVQKKLVRSRVLLSAQDAHSQQIGPFTGEVSPQLLRDLGVSLVILGHSERRALGETDAIVGEKVRAVLQQKLTPIVCVGERERDEQGHFFGFVEAQLRAMAASLSAAQIKKVIIAYEPIWAIGTGHTATVEDVKEMQLFIESTLTKLFDRATAKRVRLLYGGSVKPHNAATLHAEGGMNGFLVGGASLKVEDFVAIINAVV